jgi:hypothetical protein
MLASIHAIAARLLQSNDPKLAVLLDQRIRELMAQLPECQEVAAAAQRPGVRVIRVVPRGAPKFLMPLPAPHFGSSTSGVPTQRRAKGRK